MISSERTGLLGLIYAIVAIAIYQVAADLNMFWLAVTQAPIAAYFALRWPQESTGTGSTRSIYVLGLLATAAWIALVLGSELAMLFFPVWLQHNVKSLVGVAADESSRVPPPSAFTWDLSGTHAKVENGSTWVAAIFDGKLFCVPLRETVSNIIAPTLNSVAYTGAMLTLLLTLVCGAGLFIAGYIANRQQDSKS